MSTPPTKKLRLTSEHVTNIASQPASACYFTDFSISSRTRGRRAMPAVQVTCSPSRSPHPAAQRHLPLNPNVDSLRLCRDIDDAGNGGSIGVNVDQSKMTSPVDADLRGLNQGRGAIRSAEVVKARYIRTLQQYQSVSSLIDALTAQQMKLDERRQKLFNVLETLSKMYKLIKRRSSAVSVSAAGSPKPPAAAAYRIVPVDGRSSGPAAEVVLVGAPAADAQVSSSTSAAGLEVVYELEEEQDHCEEPEDLSVGSRWRRDVEWTAVDDEVDCHRRIDRDYSCSADDAVAKRKYYGEMRDGRETLVACYSASSPHFSGPVVPTDFADNYCTASPGDYLLPQPAHCKKVDVNSSYPQYLQLD